MKRLNLTGVLGVAAIVVVTTAGVYVQPLLGLPGWLTLAGSVAAVGATIAGAVWAVRRAGERERAAIREAAEGDRAEIRRLHDGPASKAETS